MAVGTPLAVGGEGAVSAGLLLRLRFRLRLSFFEHVTLPDG